MFFVFYLCVYSSGHLVNRYCNMALTVTEKFRLQTAALKENQPFFQVTAFRPDKRCAFLTEHLCDRFKVFWIEDGIGTYKVDTNEFSIEGSGIFCLSPGQYFSIKTEAVKSAYEIAFDKDFYCVETHGKEIACNGLLFNNVHRATVVKVEKQEESVFKNIINQMIFELKNGGSSQKDLLESYLRMFLIHTLRLVEKQEVGRLQKSHLQDPQVQDFVAMVNKHFREEHTVGGYAKKLFITPKSLAKKLNALGYPTPMQIIKDRLVLEAKRQLRFTDRSIKEIAFNLGFEDPAYFSRVFSKASGMSPAAYRAES